VDGISLVIFDCDGVLIDSELISATVLMQQFAAAGVEVDLAYLFEHCLGRSFATVAETVGQYSGRELPADFETRYREALLRRFETELRPMPGAADVLAALKVPACIATSSGTERAQRSLAIAGFGNGNGRRRKLFTGSMVKRGKPAPDLFLLAANTMQVMPAECLVVEDSDMGVQAARAAGMQVWRFTGGSHFAAGYRSAPQSARADRELSSMALFFRGFEGLARN
jgi:beta-phosphoglucomutase-like phosphatase (HAD superfamily)